MIRVSRIQRFCLDDGPGIRTTVFLGGCNLRCPWCSNPEAAFGEPSSFTEYIPSHLLEEVLKDRAFYGGDGGVTFSGGEPLLQVGELVWVWEQLKKLGVDIAVETAGFVSESLLATAIELIDLFIVDAKILDSSRCQDVIGGDIRTYLTNISELAAVRARSWLRVPLIKPYTTSGENLRAIANVIARLKPERVELLSGHNLGLSKWKLVSREGYRAPEITDDDLREIKQVFSSYGALVCVRS